MTICKAGRKLCIKPSTAKQIVKKYRDTGMFFFRKSKKTEPTELSEVEA
jgi:hypothetical protein